MELFGKTTVNPIFFITGKLAGYFTWIVLIFMYFNINILDRISFLYSHIISYSIAGLGLVLVVLSLISLGLSTRIGLPQKETVLKTEGVYKYTRNPMYVGIHLWTIASMVYSANLIVILAGVYSFITYHYIILGEEKFLLNRFGQEYVDFKSKVRRYI